MSAPTMSGVPSNDLSAARDDEIVSERLLDAPPAVVFDAYRDPVRLARWWGPEGFTNTFQRFEFRPGGSWQFVMHGPDGTDYDNESQFVEITEPHQIVLEHLRPMHRFLLTMTLEKEGSKTRLRWRMRFDTVAECERVKQFVIPANEQNMDRLERELANH